MNPAGILHWLGAQLAAIVATVKNVAANSSQPARQTVIYTIVLIFIGWAIYKVSAKKKGK